MVAHLFSRGNPEPKEIEIQQDSEQFSSEMKRQESDGDDEIIEGTGLKLTNLEIEDNMGLDNSRAHDFDNSFVKVVEYDGTVAQ